MKKIVVLILSISMMWSFASAMATESTFTFYNGVQFGDTRSELIKKLGNKCMPEPTGSSAVMPICKLKSFSLWGGVTIAGIDNCQPIFILNENDEVYQCLYDFSMHTPGSVGARSDDEVESIFDALQRMLQNKYGVPSSLYLTDKSVYALLSYADEMDVPFTNCVELVNLYDFIVFKTKCEKISEWLIPAGNGDYVLINNFTTSQSDGFGITKAKPHYCNFVLYTYVPKEAVEKNRSQDNWL